jgi:Asp-tRNA(Asn)/Glu-tRNA(Gln) amidotransferase A subunit family amidase
MSKDDRSGSGSITGDIFMDLSVAKIIEGYRHGAFSPSEVARLCTERVQKLEPRCRAWVCFEPDVLARQAEEAEERIKRCKPIRPLEGIPVGVKDIFNTTDFPAEMGSPIWRDFMPGNDARTVFHARQAGGLIPGKTVTAEFAVHTLDETLNPHDVTRTPGTSSSGSAAAIATGMVPVALGTQTAGSIVRPASFCGVYGCKPSFGLIPRTGMLKTTDSLDTIGFFVSQFEDMERVFDVLRVHGRDYPISNAALSDATRQNKHSAHPWRVAFVRTYTWEHAHDYAKDSITEWVNRLSDMDGIDVVEAELPDEMTEAHDVHSTIYDKTLSYYFKEEFKKEELVSDIMNDIIRSGNEISVSAYRDALKRQERLAHLMDDFFKDYDVLISLSTAGEAPLRHEREKPDPALIWTMTHLPVISAPVFISPNGLPFGVQLVARRYNDLLLFRLAEYLRSLELIPAGPNPCFGS